MRLLLVEDNVRVEELVAHALRGGAYGVDSAATVAELLSSAAVVQYDLIIINLGLPDCDGLDAIRSLRAEGCTAPILIMTARGSVEDRVGGLDAGADDYLIKPFNNAELFARVRALLRRPSKLEGPVLRRGNTELDEGKAEVLCSGRRIDLRLSERRLLALLMRRSGKVVSRGEVEARLSKCSRKLSGNAIEALVSRIRKTLCGANSDIVIETVRGVGYRLNKVRGGAFITSEPKTESSFAGDRGGKRAPLVDD